MATDFSVDGQFTLVGGQNVQAQIDRLVRYGVSAAKAGNFEIAEQVEQALSRKLGQKYEAKAKVSLQYDSNSGQLVAEQKKILPILQQTGALIEKNEKVQRGSLSSLRGQVREATQLRDGIVKVDAATGKLNPKWVEANQQVNALNVKVAEVGGNLLQVAKAKFPAIGQVLSLGNAFGQAVFIGTQLAQTFQLIVGAFDPVIARAKQLEGLTLALQGFGATSQEASDVLESARRVALTYGASLTSIEKAYKRLTPAILASGGSFAETEEVISALTARTTLLGLNTEQTGRYIEAFAQVMGKGKLQSEELTQQFSELDGALRAQLASYFKSEKGITDLEAAMKDGEIRAADFREAFVSVSQAMTDKLAGAVNQVQQRLNAFNGDSQLTIQQMQNLQSTLDTLTVESFATTFEEFGRSIARIGVSTSQFFASIANDLPGLKELFSTVFGNIGILLERLWTGTLVAIKLVLKAIDLVIEGFVRLRDGIASIPGVAQAIQFAQQQLQANEQVFRQIADAVLSLGSASVEAKTKFADYAANARQLTTDFLNGKISADQYKAGIDDLKNAAAVKQDPEGVKVIDEAVNKVKDSLGGVKEKLQTELSGLDDVLKKVKEKYDAEKQKVKEVQDAINDRIAEEKTKYEETKTNIKDRYDAEIDNLKDVLQLVKDRYAEELNALDQLTPAEQALQQIRKEELIAKTQSAELSEKERLEAQASLDAISRREEKEKLRLQQKQEEKTLNDDIKAVEEERDDLLNNAEEKYKNIVGGLKEQLSTQEDVMKSLDKEYKAHEDQVNALKEKYDANTQSLEDLNKAFNDQVDAVKAAGEQYDTAASSVDTLDSNLGSATKAAGELNKELGNLTKITGGGENRFAGGPVTAGRTYTVNEAGQEAFLSAAGRLSLINKKSFGQWRAPGSGTVIPAHLTSQLDIPAGGVNLKSAGVAPASRNSIGAGARGSVTYGSSDRVTNNITIQSQQPVQDASKLMINVIKRRNRRSF